MNALEIARRLRVKGMAYQGATDDMVALLDFVESWCGAHATHSEECWRWHLECCKQAVDARTALLRRWLDFETMTGAQLMAVDEDTRRIVEAA